MKFKLSTIFLSALFAFWLNVRGQTEQKLLRFLCIPVKYVDARGATRRKTCPSSTAVHTAAIKYNGYTHFLKHERCSWEASLAPCGVADTCTLLLRRHLSGFIHGC